jgi:hypothetical protein
MEGAQGATKDFPSQQNLQGLPNTMKRKIWESNINVIVPDV